MALTRIGGPATAAMPSLPQVRAVSNELCSWKFLVGKRAIITSSKSRLLEVRRGGLRSSRRLRCTGENSDPSTPSSQNGEAQPSPPPSKPPPSPSPPPVPSKTGNRIVALVSAAAAVCLFLANRGAGVGPNLSELSAKAMPYEEAIHNGKPTVVEFYADWCEVCREMARDVYSVEEKYRDRVNFVMLNVDNSKWEAELDEFGVEGIPHFAFLDGKGNEEGNIVGRLPKKYFAENVDALAKGQETIPHSKAVGQFSNAEMRQSPRMASPRTHG
ncbi:thioredoxin-like protein HCF164, chloroplastic [Selaginella moellendorffii]|uniref:thioredoxin-like protein HCF164, chloroplastic n=1 Tax=Selaginella moellendorffii TaxID=88036 RepID=UPI000D1CA2B5|nr:thioredoxin-like protein HCF164, chloroplastic [Selaginella moellendorffii]XP_024524080.1 thioredoxin-like protein HCF164, chloroplastic [Selaginella moellendorffii]|eukprot:XP_024524079.1 thioredoxin-like protein HCF164, chloroplastic [Selaginella moellendorffii]